MNSKEEFLKIVNQFIKELQSGAIIPSANPPKYIINVFCVPKKDAKTGLMTKLRVVRHGSFAASNMTSINQWISEDKCKMPTLPNLKDYVRTLFPCDWMSLRDLSDAFRQIGLAQADDGYLGYSLFGLYFIDKKQPYGIASAAANCQSFAQIIISILNKKLHKKLRNKILVHIDDFCLAAKTKEQAQNLKDKFDALCGELNVLISHEKNIDVVQRAVLYGFVFDLKNKTVGIPEDKQTQLKILIQNTLLTKVITGRALETLCGKIMHWSQLYRPAKALCYNMISYLHKLLRQKKDYKRLCFKVPKCIIQDLKFWIKYLDLIKEVDMKYILNQPTMLTIGTSDACDDGAGFCIDRHWGYYKFPKHHKKWHINQKEAHAVIMMIHNLKHYLTGKRLILMVDNTPLFYSMAKHWGSEALMPFVYEICILMMKYKIQIWFEWIPTKDNVLADSLSRYDFNTFWKWTKIHNMTFFNKPTPLEYYNTFTFLS